MKYYLLDNDHNVIETDDMRGWAKRFKGINRVVRTSVGKVSLEGQAVGNVTISTVFLGMDHSFGCASTPVLFETMVFGGVLDGEMDRCSTWEAAEKMHEKMCEKVKLAVANTWRE